MRYITPGIEAPEPTVFESRTEAEQEAARKRSGAWLDAWKALSPAQQKHWRSLHSSVKEASYKWSADELTARMRAAVPAKARRIAAPKVRTTKSGLILVN